MVEGFLEGVFSTSHRGVVTKEFRRKTLSCFGGR